MLRSFKKKRRREDGREGRKRGKIQKRMREQE